MDALELLQDSFLDAEAFNADKKVSENRQYRKVLSTSESGGMQIVAMSIQPGETIPLEKHDGDQLIIVKSGSARVILESIDGSKVTKFLKHGGQSTILIGKGVRHVVYNTQMYDDLKLLSIYCPAVFSSQTRQKRQRK